MPILLFIIVFFSSFSAADWEPTFVDNFDESQLSLSRWITGQENLPRQLQSYHRDQVNVENGVLQLATHVNTDGARPYRSGAVTSQGLFAQQYGYFEIRAKLPAGNGFWPAFWLMPVTGQWTSEIDIFEYIGDRNELHHAMHYDWRSQNKNGKTISPSANLNTHFNTYALHWTPSFIRYLVNGQVTHEITNDRIVGKANEAMYVMLNTAIASQHTGWIGGADSSSKLPATFEIDYVRVYKPSSNGQFKTIPSHHVKLDDIAPIAYDNTTVSIDVLDTATSTPAIVRKDNAINARLQLTAHQALKTTLWVSLHKATKFHRNGRIDSEKIKVKEHKLNFSRTGEQQQLDIIFEDLKDEPSGSYYFIDVVVRDQINKHSNRSAAGALSYQFPGQKKAIYWDAFIKNASVTVSGAQLKVTTSLLLQEAMLTEYLLLHYRLYDKNSGQTLSSKQKQYFHKQMGLIDITQSLPLPRRGGPLALEIGVSDASGQHTTETVDVVIESSPNTVEP